MNYIFKLYKKPFSITNSYIHKESFSPLITPILSGGPATSWRPLVSLDKSNSGNNNVNRVNQHIPSSAFQLNQPLSPIEHHTPSTCLKSVYDQSNNETIFGKLNRYFHTSSLPPLIGLRSSSSLGKREHHNSEFDDHHDYTILKEWKPPDSIKSKNHQQHMRERSVNYQVDSQPLYEIHHRSFTLPLKKGEEAQNCVKFETHRSNYLVELIEGILPKELILGSKILVKITEPAYPNIIFMNFPTAVKAYQANQFMLQWNEYTPPSNKIKSTLIKKSLEPLYTITQDTIESLPQYPTPERITIIDDHDGLEEKIVDLLLDGMQPSQVKLINNIELGVNYEWYHRDYKSEDQTFYVLTLCNNENCVVFNLEKLGDLPQIINDILESRTIGKVGYNHKLETLKFEKQFNTIFNNFDDLSKRPIVMRSKPKTLRAIVGLFLRQKVSGPEYPFCLIPNSDIHRYSTNLASLFTEKKIQNYAIKAHCAKSLYYVLESDRVDFNLSFEEGDHLDYIEDD